jgi:hypothetical protein
MVSFLDALLFEFIFPHPNNFLFFMVSNRKGECKGIKTEGRPSRETRDWDEGRPFVLFQAVLIRTRKHEM